MKFRFAIALLGLAMLCASAVAQEESAEDWYQKGQELRMNGSLDEALTALDKAITLDPENADAWQYKALTLRDLERFNESLEAFQRPWSWTLRTTRPGLRWLGCSWSWEGALRQRPCWLRLLTGSRRALRKGWTSP